MHRKVPEVTAPTCPQCSQGTEPGRKLTQPELELLPDETEIVVTWSGGNGPHRYVWRVQNGVGCAYTIGEQSMLVGHPRAQDYPLDQVWLPGHELCRECERKRPGKAIPEDNSRRRGRKVPARSRFGGTRLSLVITGAEGTNTACRSITRPA